MHVREGDREGWRQGAHIYIANFIVLDSGEAAEHNPDGFLFLEVTVQ